MRLVFQAETQNEGATSSAVETNDSVAKNFLEPNAFTIRDLTSLLKNLETEISLNEMNLNDENDKRFMFKVNI